MVDLKHPDLPDVVISVTETSVHVHATAGWKRVDGQPIVDPTAPTEEAPTRRPRTTEASPATNPSQED